MSDFKVGDIVRVKQSALASYLTTFGKRIADRDATILFIGDGQRLRAGVMRVQFHKRNGRGLEFIENVYASEIEHKGASHE